MSERTYDLAVVGAGILGAFHAYHALHRGLRVLLLEKDAAPAGATVRNFGQVVPSGMKQGIWQQRGRESTALYKELQTRFDLSVRHNGTVYLASDDDEARLIHELKARNDDAGYPCEILSAEECLARFSPLKPAYIKAGLFFPEEVTVESRVAISRLIAFMVEQMGLEFRPRTAVTELEVSDADVRLRAPDGSQFWAERVAVCNGREFRMLFPDLFRESDLVTAKLHMMQTRPLPQVKLPGAVLTGTSIRRYESFQECPSYASRNSEHLHPDIERWGIHILFKQTPDGSIILGDSHEYTPAADADDRDFDIDWAINERMIQLASEILDLPDWTPALTWAGFYSQTGNGEPFARVIDERVHVLTGLGGKGMTAGPTLARENVERMFG